jgi:hypothetical protein
LPRSEKVQSGSCVTDGRDAELFMSSYCRDVDHLLSF